MTKGVNAEVMSEPIPLTVLVYSDSFGPEFQDKVPPVEGAWVTKLTWIHKGRQGRAPVTVRGWVTDLQNPGIPQAVRQVADNMPQVGTCHVEGASLFWTDELDPPMLVVVFADTPIEGRGYGFVGAFN